MEKVALSSRFRVKINFFLNVSFKNFTNQNKYLFIYLALLCFVGGGGRLFGELYFAHQLSKDKSGLNLSILGVFIFP